MAELHRNVTVSSKYWARQKGVDYDELSVDVLERMSAADPAHWGNKGYVSKVAKNAASQMISGSSSGCEFEAYDKFREQKDDFEQANGRSMTSREEDQLAEEIRSYQAPGRRAKPDFHKRKFVHTLSLDAPSGDGESGIIDRLPATEIDPETLIDNSDEIERAEKLRKKAGIWGTIATIYEAPQVTKSGIEWNVASDIRRRVKELGGARNVAQAWLNGEISEEASDPLFTPWDGKGPRARKEPLTIRERDKVASTLVSLPESHGGISPANNAWNDAVGVATRKKPRAKRDWKTGPNRGKAIKTDE